ncbi:MAG: MerR family transcriptional regulator [Solobacterium sp.]|jgi:ubiquinone/menaquinone biosynthesis C-methylase UbiE/DNA-binding transcriptional MerR regulator|nr:MerR family transcriptional regulator [Solobacterium sp.]
MKKEGYYSCGEFARKANVTVRTIRFYDKQNILKPSFRNENGARFYTNDDLAKLQQILLLKYLGLSLDDIKEMTVAAYDPHFLMESLSLQKKLVAERIEEMKNVENAIDHTVDALHTDSDIDWNNMLALIQMTTMENSLKTAYVDAANISARIRLHTDYSVNQEGWFPWLYKQCHIKKGMKILEIGCGNGQFWTENLEHLPKDIHIVLSDVSEGMIRDVHRTLSHDSRFSYRVFDAEKLPYKDSEFDLVIANHVLFYCHDIDGVLKECRRVLTEKGKFVCSTYGRKHMQEITQLVQEFNAEIVLSADHLYENFGLENGEEILRKEFNQVSCLRYEDAIEINTADPLISYILSCHGNQNHILLDHYKEFREFVGKKVENGFHITKDAGMFLCR